MISFHDLTLDPKTPVYQQIGEHVKRQVLLGNAEDGDVLPSRREIATILKVNLNTVQKAFRLLEEEGLIVTGKNAPSRLSISEKMEEEIWGEMTSGLVADFIRKAKENHLSFKKTVELLSELWEEEDS